ncbi:MAG: CPBP family intramembrane metalloprotease [Lachnospiraceae bacterium]|nr:CPBP family intramembrane metalloprotease [Lachnospiraceae bacterium]
MKSKNLNFVFLIIIIINIVMQFLVAFVPALEPANLFQNVLVSEGSVIAPALVYLFTSRVKINNILGFRKMRISTWLCCILFTVLCGPVATLANAISMLFVDNTVTGMSGSILDMPFITMLLLIGFAGPICEEITFRGIFYGGYRSSGLAWRAVLGSAIAFGVMHLNFNQAAYAFVLGIAMALLVEACGSLWGSITMHVLFNSTNVCILYLYNHFFADTEVGALAEDIEYTQNDMLLLIGSYLMLAAIFMCLAGCVLVLIAKLEKRDLILAEQFWKREKKQGKLISVSFIMAIVIAVIFMIWLEMLKK